MPILPVLRRRGVPRSPEPTSPVVVQAAAPAPTMPRALLVLLGLALAFAVLLGLNQLKDYIAPVFLALNLVIAAAPLQGWMLRRGLPKALAAGLAGLAVFTFLVLFFWALGWAAAQLVQELPKYEAQFTQLYEQTMDLLQRFGLDQATINEQLKNAINPGAIAGTLGGVLGGVGGLLGLLSTAAIVIFFLMVDTMSAGRRMELVHEQHPRLATALTAFAKGVNRYWVVTTVFGLIVAGLDVVALWILGVPLALAWGVLSFLTNYIPNVGFVIGLIPPALMALLANGPTNALITVVVYTVINFVVQSLIQPKFTGDAVGITPTVTFLSLVVWAWVLGPVGALLALPATLLVKAILVDADPQARWVNAFIGSNPESARADSATESALQQS